MLKFGTSKNIYRVRANEQGVSIVHMTIRRFIQINYEYMIMNKK